MIVIGISAGYIDEATHFRFEFLSDHFNIFLLALLVGVLSASVGIIGSAKHQNRGRRARMAGLAFAFPWILIGIGYPIDGSNIHGPSALALILIIPASILALTLLSMAGF